MTPFTMFRAFDGEEFADEDNCRSHEKANAHLRLVGLSREAVDAALAGADPELADAIEVVGARIMRARLASGVLKHRRREAEPKQITHQPSDVEREAIDALEKLRQRAAE